MVPARPLGAGVNARLHQQPHVPDRKHPRRDSGVTHPLPREHRGVALAPGGIAETIPGRPQPRVAAPLAQTRGRTGLDGIRPAAVTGAPSRAASHSRTSHSPTGASSTPMYVSSIVLALQSRCASTPAQSSRWMRFVNFGGSSAQLAPVARSLDHPAAAGSVDARKAHYRRGDRTREHAPLPRRQTLAGEASRGDRRRLRQPTRRRPRRRPTCSIRRRPCGADRSRSSSTSSSAETPPTYARW